MVKKKKNIQIKQQKYHLSYVINCCKYLTQKIYLYILSLQIFSLHREIFIYIYIFIFLFDIIKITTILKKDGPEKITNAST